MKNEELKPCPNCNGQNIKNAHIICPHKIRSRYIVCEDCGWCGKTRVTKRRAAKAWNKEHRRIIAIEAIEKQIPKKPIDDSYPWVICPTCSGSVFTKHIIEHIQNKETTYCEHCGQAIDWRTTE